MTQKHNRPHEMHTWYYYPIPMPVDKDGKGPVSYQECDRVLFEVWNQDLASVSSHEYLVDAINDALKRNNEIGWNVSIEEIINFTKTLDK